MGVVENVKRIGGCFLGLLTPLILGFLLILFLSGGLWLSDFLYPILATGSGITFLVCLLILAPLALFAKTRAVSGVGFLISSYIFGATLWIWSFLLSYSFWGFVGLFIGLFLAGFGVVPVSMLASIVNGEWSIFGQLLLLLLMTFGFRILGIYLAAKADADRGEVVVGDHYID